MTEMTKILCVGPQWRGSNAGGLFRALSRVGYCISIIDENYYINLSNQSTKVKALDRAFRGWHIDEFNNAILREVRSFAPDLVLIYKGAFVKEDTLLAIKHAKIKVVNFYPDVSFRTHGSLLGKTLPLYDHVFTTKTFGIKDMHEQLGVASSSFIPHGFDPDIHKKSNVYIRDFACDASFIGGYSEKKQQYLSAIKKALPDINIKIWGSRWENARLDELKSSIQYRSIVGDQYALGIQCSKINLGLLHEKVTGASSGDLITSRTFHIPGAGGFMMHERTSEIGLYFEEDKEIVCFASEEELQDKMKHYLKNDTERNKIAEAGYLRAQKDHSLDARAKYMMSLLN